MPFMKINVSFYLKDPPKGYAGPRMENWNFGEKPVRFGVLMAGIIYRALQFYLATVKPSATDANAEIQGLAESLKRLTVKANQ